MPNISAAIVLAGPRSTPGGRAPCRTSKRRPALAHILVAGDAEQALTVLDEQQVVCLVVDVMLPAASGFDLCRRVRETSDLPLLFLTARGDDSDKLRGLGLGADDYIVKSATPAEVVARIKAVLRRAPAALGRDGDSQALRFGRLRIDLAAHEVALGERAVRLTAREFETAARLRRAPAAGPEP